MHFHVGPEHKIFNILTQMRLCQTFIGTTTKTNMVYTTSELQHLTGNILSRVVLCFQVKTWHIVKALSILT